MTATSMRPLRFIGDSLKVLRELTGRGQGRDWVCVGARPEGQDAGERQAPERYCTGRPGDCFRLQGRYVQGRLYREVPTGCFPFCMCSRRSPNGASRHRSMKWNSWKGGWRKWWNWRSEPEELRLNNMNYAKQGRITMKKHGYVEGTGNVYADLGVVNPQEARAKADLAHRIVDIIEARKLTQVQAGKVSGVDQPKVSALKRGRLSDFSSSDLLASCSYSTITCRLPSRPNPIPAGNHRPWKW